MPDLFASPKRRIASAQKRIKDLQAGIKSFLNGKPYARVVEPYADGTNQAHTVKLVRPMPDDVIDDAIWAAEALRSALDQAGFASSVASGKINPKRTHFPIADSLAQLETDVIGRGRCKDLPPEILALFRSFQPYKGGNDLIWALNQVANGTKHRLLIPIGMATGRTSIKHFHAAELSQFRSDPQWDTEKDEIIFAVIGPDTHVEYDMQLTFFVAFGPVEVIRRQPAIAVLNAMASEVERVILAAEAETRRLGFIS
jgi:hypothetical protein